MAANFWMSSHWCARPWPARPPWPRVTTPPVRSRWTMEWTPAKVAASLEAAAPGFDAAEARQLHAYFIERACCRQLSLLPSRQAW